MPPSPSGSLTEFVWTIGAQATLALTTALFVSFVYLLAPTLLILSFWPGVVRRMPALERSRELFCGAMWILSLPAAIVLTYQVDHGRMRVFVLSWLVVWLALIAPRFAVPFLKLGAFAKPDAVSPAVRR